LQGGANLKHKTDPKYDTGDFNDDPRPGNLRIDYVLPNTGTQVDEAQVFWPTRDDELFRLTGLHPFPTSDHRMVWTKLRFPAAEPPAPEQPNPGDQGQAGPSGAGKSGKLANSGTHVGLLGMIALTAGLGGALLIAQRRARRRRA
ncbi:MAG: endonuclease/exonuclease/phosphatase family protein, partial [Actinomyces oris]